MLASGSDDNTIRLWNPLTGEHLQTLEGHSSSIRCLAWSPDGRMLASSSDDNTIRLWNSLEGHLIRILEGHTEEIYGISFSEKYPIFASISQDDYIRIWNTNIQQIDWNAKATTVTTETFKRIKDFVLALKERKDVLVSRSQLRTLLAATDPEWQFTDAEMMTAVGHLQNHGYVTILRRSSEDESILLAPDLLINLAASYILKAQSNERGLGSLDEVRALRNEYRFPEVQDLSGDERDTLLNAVTELFLQRNVCFRESVDNQTFLIFPSLIQEQPPLLVGDAQQVEDLTYIVEGQIENVYPALVVLLGYAPSFQRMNQCEV